MLNLGLTVLLILVIIPGGVVGATDIDIETTLKGIWAAVVGRVPVRWGGSYTPFGKYTCPPQGPGALGWFTITHRLDLGGPRLGGGGRRCQTVRVPGRVTW